jgi:glycosidase
MEFHISRMARERFLFDESLFSLHGNVIFANFHAARAFTQKLNEKLDLLNFPERALKASQVNAMGLIDELMHVVIQLYREKQNPLVFEQALTHLEEQFGTQEVHHTMLRFNQEFPPLAVFRKQMTVEEYLEGTTTGRSNLETTLEEMLMLWVGNKNPAMGPYQEILFDDSALAAESGYLKVIHALYAFFNDQPKFGPEHQNLVDMLRSPAIHIPASLTGQLEFIRTRWMEALGKYLYRLLSSLDFLKEEEKFNPPGPGPTPIPLFDLASREIEYEQFTPDKEWMPRLVLMAKNAYVWLDQMSKKYQRQIRTLDQVPDEELDQLAQWGFSGLWLIGVWERSQASAQIKQLCGNPEAIASAYSLKRYDIAFDLGGESAYQNLKSRAWQRGIRLGSDMVPNHMGIDSDWVLNHPDWFISLDHSPYPSYSFNGQNLSPQPEIGIFVEDHYYNRTDAAVVFKRVDYHTGDTRYIYHGNDGTSMPWNDTAQLNYLKPEVREALIQTILHVARQFPIIRFDAAMTLAKRHFQRLWFPEPGSGGDIPTRAGQGLSKDEFNQAIPVEFWREVVDRATVEAPDTLLLAEAFWLMEGFFVRTLGMHRVYNSAFMNLLRNEDNAKYRLVMKNTLEFDPEILKRYVNFLNNPDERTAVDQFGKGDKYFGICMLMSTLPGLPMFGHGQIEGYSEKYGMEFRKAYWDEIPDPYLVERHAREIFPLLQKRALFAGVENFLLYDFHTPDGLVNEDVYAYSNSLDGVRAMVVFHNRFASTEGWVRISVGFAQKQDGDNRNLVHKTLAEGLDLPGGDNLYTIFRDSASRLEYIRPVDELRQKGFYLLLNAYESHVFTDFRFVVDDQMGSYRQIYQYLQGRGVPKIEDAMKELLLQPVQGPFRQIANAGYLSFLYDNCLSSPLGHLPDHLIPEARQKARYFLDGCGQIMDISIAFDPILDRLERNLKWILSLKIPGTRSDLPGFKNRGNAMKFITAGLATPHTWHTLFLWAFLDTLDFIQPQPGSNHAIDWMDEWQLGNICAEAWMNTDWTTDKTWRQVQILRLLLHQGDWWQQKSSSVSTLVTGWLTDEMTQNFLGFNRYQDLLWYNQEAFEEFIWWMNILAQLQAISLNKTEQLERLLGSWQIAIRLLQAEKASGFQVTKLLTQLKEK